MESYRSVSSSETRGYENCKPEFQAKPRYIKDSVDTVAGKRTAVGAEMGSCWHKAAAQGK